MIVLWWLGVTKKLICLLVTIRDNMWRYVMTSFIFINFTSQARGCVVKFSSTGVVRCSAQQGGNSCFFAVAIALAIPLIPLTPIILPLVGLVIGCKEFKRKYQERRKEQKRKKLLEKEDDDEATESLGMVELEWRLRKDVHTTVILRITRIAFFYLLMCIMDSVHGGGIFNDKRIQKSAVQTR